MTREVMDKATLEEMILKKVRASAECANVRHVGITASGDDTESRGLPNWEPTFVIDGAAGTPYAASQIARAFQQRFDCRFPS